MTNGKARRGAVRIRIWNGVKADVAIDDVLGSRVESKATPVLIRDVCPIGVRFLTHLRFPVSPDYRIRLSLSFGEWTFSLAGYVVWRRKEENLYAYGCRLIPDPQIRRALSAALKEKLGLMIPERRRILSLYQQMLDGAAVPSSAYMDTSL
ncbi:hypothetical protein SAMN02799624_02515 [Paenibacillus sp. UNC496MF]|nr:hypothetical protein SAMN02799624_02515 [Paenibacillus sp. UNC496MF]